MPAVLVLANEDEARVGPECGVEVPLHALVLECENHAGRSGVLAGGELALEQIAVAGDQVPGDVRVTVRRADESPVPQLGALASNGGPTETQLPSVNSPVVDKGSAPGNLTTDQRGNPRTVDTSVANADDGTDIGSVELSNGPPGPPPAATTPVTPKKKKCKKKKK